MFILYPIILIPQRKISAIEPHIIKGNKHYSTTIIFFKETTNYIYPLLNIYPQQ